MAHYARINGENRVVQLVVAEEDVINSGVLGPSSEWIQYSYNTRGNIHYDPSTGKPSIDQSKALRKNPACVDGIYDIDDDAFHTGQPYHLWALNNETYIWEAPEPKPDGDHAWIETFNLDKWSGEWVLI
jgi:hypothetical protein